MDLNTLAERFVSAIERIADALAGPEVASDTPVAPDAEKRGRGRPAGSKTKTTGEATAAAPAGSAAATSTSAEAPAATAAAAPVVAATTTAAASTAAETITDKQMQDRAVAMVNAGLKPQLLSLVTSLLPEGTPAAASKVPQDKRAHFMAETGKLLPAAGAKA